jgi:ABC-2 type transport system ATP-binding protein
LFHPFSEAVLTGYHDSVCPSTMTTAAHSHPHSLVVRALRKAYGNVVAVDGLDLEVRNGECFGLLGPNGAGKTTTIEICEGLLPRDSGDVKVLGRTWENDGDDLRERLGIQLQDTQLADKLTVRETIDLFRSFYRRSRDAKEVIEMVQLGEKHDARVGTLSGGQKQRLAIACALVGDPELLFLDEPTTGLDPQSRRQLWGVIEEFRATGRTIVLTTHYMDEAERLCERVAIVDHGHVIAQGSPAELIETIGSKHHPPPVQRTTSATLEDVFMVLTGRTLRDE